MQLVPKYPDNIGDNQYDENWFSGMDHIVTEWIVDEDQCFNAVTTPGFCVMMVTSTNSNYDSCSHKTVQCHVLSMGMEGKEECTVFHRELLVDNMKLVASQCDNRFCF